MKKQIFMIHGWGGQPDVGWMLWLKKELEKSDNDPYVPVDDSKLFKQRLGAKIIIEHNKGHFTGEDGIIEPPIVLDELLNLINPEL